MSAFDETPVHRKKSRRGEAAPRWFGEMGQADFEVDFYERILARHPNYVVVLRASASSWLGGECMPGRWRSIGGW